MEDIEKIVNHASALYAKKDFNGAAEQYAEACEKSAETKGEEDADLLFLYGKALFQCAVSNSQVLGGTAAVPPPPEEPEEPKEKDARFQFSEEVPLAEEEDSSEEDGVAPADDPESSASESEQEDGGQEEEQTDFEAAWEILDLTRTLFEKQLKDLGDPDDVRKPLLTSDKEETSDPRVVVMKKLADVYDILGEVSLEAENFQQAATDLASSLKLRRELYPASSSLVSESHYKLSLAYEFCVEDPSSIANAVKQMELAISSISEKKESVDADLLQDMKARLVDLKRDPEEKLKEEKAKIIEGLLGQASSSSAEGKPAPATASAVNDLTSMVKKRKSSSGKISNKKAKK